MKIAKYATLTDSILAMVVNIGAAVAYQIAGGDLEGARIVGAVAFWLFIVGGAVVRAVEDHR